MRCNLWAAKAALGLRARMEAKAPSETERVCLNQKGRQQLFFRSFETEKGREYFVRRRRKLIREFCVKLGTNSLQALKGKVMWQWKQ